MDALRYRPDVDGLRAVAVVAVLLYHLDSRWLPGGFVGVDVFFVISGYLIGGIILGEEAAGRFSFARFYARRARRLLPALYAVLALTLLAGWFLLLPSDYRRAAQAAFGTVFISSNVVFWQQLAEGYFAVDAKNNPLLHTWSLGVEEQFYLVFPALLIALRRFVPERLPVALAIAAILSFAAAEASLDRSAPAVFFLSPFRAWELLVGALLATGTIPALSDRTARAAAGVAGLVAIVAACVLLDGESRFPGAAALAPVLGAALVIHSGSGPVSSLLAWRPVVYVGLISYSLYLVHWPLITLVKQSQGQVLETGLAIGVGAAAIAFAALSHRFVEQPFRRAPGSVPPRRLVLPVALASLVVLVPTVAGIVTQGHPSRFEGRVTELDGARDPEIPFRTCNRGRTVPCPLGVEGGTATTLYWGDSHMLSWAPAIDEALAREGRVGGLYYTSACPPVVGLQVERSPKCRDRNLAALQWLREHDEVDTVVLAARWKYNFDNPQWFSRDGPDGADTLDAALRDTVARLSAAGKRVVILGQPPEFSSSVPVQLARQIAYGAFVERQTRDDYRREHERFLSAIARIDDPRVEIADPSATMCDDVCAMADDGVVFYRDNHHLSVAGARRFWPRVLPSRAATSTVVAPIHPASDGG